MRCSRWRAAIAIARAPTRKPRGCSRLVRRFVAIFPKKLDVAFGVRSIAANLDCCSGERRGRYSRRSSLLKRDVRALGTKRPAVLAPRREQRVSTFIGQVSSILSHLNLPRFCGFFKHCAPPLRPVCATSRSNALDAINRRPPIRAMSAS
jgi:hypothetical protein